MDYRVDNWKTMEAKNFGLAEDEFDKMVEELKQGKEDMFELIYLRHFESCIKYLRSEYNAEHTDAYDSVMHTLLQFRESLKDGKIKYGNVRYLFTRMAANKYLKTKKRQSKFDLKDILPDRPIGEKTYSEEEMDMLDRAWKELGEPCQKLLKAHFFDRIKMVEIAEIFGRSAVAIRKQKERCVNTLRNNFLKLI